MASQKAGLPTNSSIVIPRLFCRDPARQVDFCVGAFGAIEFGRRHGPDGGVVHALLTISSEMIMIESEWPTLPSRAPAPDGSSPVVIFLYVENVDDVVQRATALGAEVIVPAQDQFWGDRIAWIKDPSGHVWTLGTRIEETTVGQRDERWSQVVSEEGDADA
jgi:PhnB protein